MKKMWKILFDKWGDSVISIADIKRKIDEMDNFMNDTRNLNRQIKN